MPEVVDYAQAARSYCEQLGIGEVPVCDMEEMPLVLRGVDGNRYAEVDCNIWMVIGGEGDVAFVGTSRHGGHMVLRPLYVMVDGMWRNLMTGKARSWDMSGCAPARGTERK